ncbi:phage baseplate assembly protein [Bradyrhizobium sp. S3.9.1]|uniref:phage baseplate assembly protein n=1 Tax=Bradyrhizobium sp. S3.9.1 TaxID=3156431 RepID=UPI003394A27C
MNRNSLLEMSGRAMHQIVRMTLNKSNDDPMMQELDFDGMNSEGRQKVERVQGFGFTSTPLPRDEKKGQQSQGGGGSGGVGGDGEQAKGPAAEGIAVFVGGQRNHPVVIAVDDRRHRPMGLNPGENAQYDDQGQMTLLRRGGLFLLSLDDEEGSGNGGASARAADGSQQENKERMVSLRHVMKKKQERGSVGGSGSGGGSGGGATRAAAGGSQSKSDHKHEGEEVNTEVRATKKKIEIFDKDTAVATYDRQSGTWTFKSKNITMEASDKMILKCTNGPTEIWGKPIKFNGGGPSSPPFEVPG